MRSLTFQNLPPATRRWMAAATALVFIQGVAGTFLHFDVESHHFCVEHEQLTHDADHAEDARSAERDRLAQTEPTPLQTPSDRHDDRQSDDCQWMTWLQNNSQASPDLAPQMLDLPPPAPALETSPSHPHHTPHRPISIGHVSPMNSPPTA